MTDDRRERKKRETRAALRVAALRLVDERGLDHVTVEMIAEAADVSPRTFFNYFTSKEAPLLGPAVDVRAEVEQFWDARPVDEPPFETLRAMLVERAGTFAGGDEVALRMRVLNANPALHARFHAGFAELERVIRERIGARTGLDPDRDLYPALLAAAGWAAMRVAMELWRTGGSHGAHAAPGRLPDLVAAAFDVYAGGLAAAPPAPRSRHPRRARAAPLTA